ncbi:hypothetical protein [Mycolicibacterium sp.]|uniref:hypothetical protein n=1 Tax=Mycolicibacterium sp. TaxID=2320850 RepID=UPI001A35CB82|nr:hypothetical protein [Mycolicibacterium sp.]MBJ7341265.1 hypothetical protein [Mycolicibacterium sp.]
MRSDVTDKRWPWIAAAVVVVVAIVGGISNAQFANEDKLFGTNPKIAELLQTMDDELIRNTLGPIV